MSRAAHILGLGLAVWMAGCSGSKNLEGTAPPEWVSQRPIARSHYIGIGSAAPNAVPGEALKTAKKRAAADLAGEIALTVESASLLESEERNGHVKEEFTSTISSRATERIEGFEVVDVWEGPQGSFVYYRLDKARHAALRESRRQEAIRLAVEEGEAGQADLAAGRVPSALDHWSTGIMGLEEFWNEVNRGTVNGEEVHLEPHLIRAMREALRNLDIRSAMDRVDLTAQSGFKFPLGLHLTHFGTSVSGVPLAYRYHNGTYMKRATEFTDDEGTVVALIAGVDPNRPDPNFTCQPDAERLFKAAGIPDIVAELIGTVTLDRVDVPISVSMPSVGLQVDPASELNAGNHQGLMRSLRSSLVQRGYAVVSDGEDADFTLAIQLAVERRTPSGDIGNFHTAYVSGSLLLRNASGQLVKEVILQRVKGVQLSADAALQLALSNATKAVEEKHTTTLIKAMR